MARGTKHGKGKGRYRKEYRKYKKKDGSVSTYWNYRERYIRKGKGGKRRITYKPGGVLSGRRKSAKKSKK